MTEETVEETGTPEQARTLLEANWRQQLPPEMRPVAERHGRELFILAYNIGSVNEALRVLQRRCSGNRELEKAMYFIAQASNMMASDLMMLREHTPMKIAEVQRDIERAAALAGASRVGENNKLIIPS